MSSISISEPSLCIPRVFPNITWEQVKETIHEVGLGEVERVDMVNKENDRGDKFKRVFVHFKRWNTDTDAQRVRDKLLWGGQVKIVYDDPWFWKVMKSNVPKPDFTKGKDVRRGRGRGPVRVEMVDEDATSRAVSATGVPSDGNLADTVIRQQDEIDKLRAQLGIAPEMESEDKTDTTD